MSSPGTVLLQMLMLCWAAYIADADDSGDSDARRRRLIRPAAEECELRGITGCGALARRRLQCASAWCSAGRGGAVGSDASAVTCSGRRWQWLLQPNLNSADDAVDVTTHDSQQGSSYSMSVNSDVICGLILFFIYVSPLGL